MKKITDESVKSELKLSVKENRIPKIIHRLLLYDTQIPEVAIDYINLFDSVNKEFIQVLWSEDDVKSLMNSDELFVYNSYSKNIQKSDYARYIILKYYGGIYADYDILSLAPIIDIYNENKNNDLFFEELTTTKEFSESTKKYKIRNGVAESNLRISNYFIMCNKNSDNINGILKLCKDRYPLTIETDYDVIYTTGPDVISTYFNSIPNIKYINKKQSEMYIIHLGFGHWINNK